MKVKQLKLVKAIMDRLNLTDDGRLLSYFNTQIKVLKSEIKNIEQNRKTAALKHEQALDNLAADLEDAENNVADQYLNVDVDRIKNNADAKSYGDEYWDRISNAEYALQALKDHKESLVETNKKAVESSDAQIAERKYRIKKLSEVVA